MKYVALLAVLSVVAAAVANAEDVTVTVTAPTADWRLTDCAGGAVTDVVPACFVLTHTAGHTWKGEYREARPASVAGTSSGIRAVYAKSRTGTRGVKLGDLTVGNVAAPVGYACDPDDVIVSGSTQYFKITDPAVVESLRGYVTGCQK